MTDHTLAAMDLAASFIKEQQERIQELEAALGAVTQAWASFEKHGEISHLDGQPLIYASTLEELNDIARAILNKEKRS